MKHSPRSSSLSPCHQPQERGRAGDNGAIEGTVALCCRIVPGTEALVGLMGSSLPLLQGRAGAAGLSSSLGSGNALSSRRSPAPFPA